MQFTINRVIIKLFGTMSQNYYQEVSNYFGINTVKELIRNRFKKFKISYGAADNYLCRLISAKCWFILTVLHIFFLIFFVSLLATVFDGEIELYIFAFCTIVSTQRQEGGAIDVHFWVRWSKGEDSGLFSVVGITALSVFSALTLRVGSQQGQASGLYKKSAPFVL